MKLKLSNETIKQEFEHDCDNGIMFYEIRVNNKTTDQYFTKKYKYKEENKLVYRYYPNLSSFFGDFEKWDFQQEESYYDFAYKSPTINIEKFDEWEHVYSHSDYSGFIFHILKEEPISIPIYCNYIGGYTNEDYDLQKCYDHLKENPNVFQLEIQEIPYYNSKFDGHKGLEYYYWPDQEEFDMLYHKYKKNQYWTVRMKDEIRTSYDNPLNLLGLKQFKFR